MEETGPQLVMSWRSVMMAMVVAPTILCGIVLLFRRVEARASQALGLALILAALSMGPQVIGFAGAYDIWPWLTFFPLFYSDLWFGPLLILHAHALTSKKPLAWRAWLLLPGLIQTVYYVSAFFLPGEGLFDHLAKWDFNNEFHVRYFVPFESLLGVGLLGFAILYIWRARRTYLAFLERNTSAAKDYDPIWWRNLVIALIAAILLYTGLEVANLLIDPTYDMMFPYQVLLLGFLCWLGLDAAWRLTTPFPKIKTLSGEPSPITDDLADRILDQLQSRRWFLEPRLSIRDVAGRMGTNESYVSRALNRQGGQSFNDVVNGMRINHAKTLLAETSDPVLTIAMDSGFNSKATFNRVFRDRVGDTPTRFRTSQKP